MQAPRGRGPQRQRRVDLWYCHACGAGHWDEEAKQCRRCGTARAAPAKGKPWVRIVEPCAPEAEKDPLSAALKAPMPEQPKMPVQLKHMAAQLKPAPQAQAQEDAEMEEAVEAKREEAAAGAQQDPSKLKQAKAVLEAMGLVEAAAQVDASLRALEPVPPEQSQARAKRLFDQADRHARKCQEHTTARTQRLEALKAQIASEEALLEQAKSEQAESE
eukprot:13592227-Alexandrium_andersonii.AAC.1